MDVRLEKADLERLFERGDNIMRRPTREEAEAAVRTLLLWAGDNPDREGLVDTPKRVVKAYEEFFCGYDEDPLAVLNRTFEEVEGYDDIVLLRDIALESHCEHHMVPIIGKAHVAYLPDRKVVGISKIARVVEIFAKRLQTQETMTAQIANALEEGLQPRGVAVLIDAKHQCMTTRGVHKPDVATITTRFTGVFKEERYERRFLDLIRGGS
ncbi:GTP cyclohydrolase I FolE [Pedomonas sp. V897]|uniref:GTP cyclohydrolase I FolE n=1 Tax=Pedomonas sp. V897 TaxID=3446482 RepID=UPI003EE002C7